jgi:hypothetical protein
MKIHSRSRRRQRDTTRRDTPPRRTCIRCGGDSHPQERCPAKDVIAAARRATIARSV